MTAETATAGAVIAGSLLLWGLVGGRLQRAELTAPIVFVALGGLLSPVVGIFEVELHAFQLLIELTLALVLFSDASGVRLPQPRADLAWYGRLLGVGLPLTVAGGWLLAASMLPGVSGWLAVLVGAALAPTDAALGAAVLTDPAVPERVRRAINVESGLNDGVATPIVLVAIAGVAGSERGGVTDALVELAVGAGIGALVGAAGGVLTSASHRRGWLAGSFAGPAMLALVVTAFTAAVATGGNGFVAAFVGGLAFGNVAGEFELAQVKFVEETGGLAAALVWLLFGAVVFPIVGDTFSWQIALYTVLSLTVLRMVPVAVSMLGMRLGIATVAFVGWFGPRGLPSIIFALLAIDELGIVAAPAVGTIALTVLVSVVAHGLSAQPLASRYGAAVSGSRDHA
ncbi:cation:proton antiporter [Prauserella cavernicola]|uniref:Cation:proton antiporter n=1 Tax=Prauserella cavernicola TaxID=2800127 RepID=A0A934QLM6_9PSEU|nr:cation:proton antiporter [Prauserella cavernicola]MBK1783157.1 cation:proton antiporter [Prauserella cavernicola]